MMDLELKKKIGKVFGIDPAELTDADIRRAITTLTRFAKGVEVRWRNELTGEEGRDYVLGVTWDYVLQAARALLRARYGQGPFYIWSTSSRLGKRMGWSGDVLETGEMFRAKRGRKALARLDAHFRESETGE